MSAALRRANLALLLGLAWPGAAQDSAQEKALVEKFLLPLDRFHRQVELAPDYPNSYDSLGDGLMAKGRVDEAIQAYRKALALNPTFTPSIRSLGKALEEAGRRDEAIAHYRACAQLGAQQGIPQAVKESKARLKALGVSE